MSGELAGRTAIITGASQGLGLAIAHAYVAAGASVMLSARSPDQLEQARAGVASRATAGQRVLADAGDVARREDVDRLVARAFDAFTAIDILVNNAGMYGPKGRIEDIDLDEWIRAIDVNLVGSVMMSRALMPHFRARRYGKIVQLSGGGATKPMPMISAYAASKAAIVRFAETLAEEARDARIDVNCVAPGALGTRMLDEIIAAGPEQVGEEYYRTNLALKERGATPLEKGAELCVFLASAASDGITGKLLSAVWDPWATVAEHKDALRNTDVYTLRRIVPKDRGLPWE